MKLEWLRVRGVIKQGHQVASGRATNSPYPKGTIEMQIPFFQALGLDLTPFFPGTLNISLSPYTFKLNKPEFTFPKVQWNPDYPPEDFSFSHCRVSFKAQIYQGLIYYPHPETKLGHFQDSSTLEIIAPLIQGVNYQDSVVLEVKASEIIVTLAKES